MGACVNGDTPVLTRLEAAMPMEVRVLSRSPNQLDDTGSWPRMPHDAHGS